MEAEIGRDFSPVRRRYDSGGTQPVVEIQRGKRQWTGAISSVSPISVSDR
jgi:hypothetical protein